jgi:hypothetical protein
MWTCLSVWSKIPTHSKPEKCADCRKVCQQNRTMVRTDGGPQQINQDGDPTRGRLASNTWTLFPRLVTSSRREACFV